MLYISVAYLTLNSSYLPHDLRTIMPLHHPLVAMSLFSISKIQIFFMSYSRVC